MLAVGLTLVMVGVKVSKKIIFNKFDLSVAKPIHSKVRVFDDLVKRGLPGLIHTLSLLHFLRRLF